MVRWRDSGDEYEDVLLRERDFDERPPVSTVPQFDDPLREERLEALDARHVEVPGEDCPSCDPLAARPGRVCEACRRELRAGD